MRDHEKLDVYAVALQLAALSYGIAEGCERRAGKARERFMVIARGSATETAALID